MIKCDFCTNSAYNSYDGKLYCKQYSNAACTKAAQLFAEVIKSSNSSNKTITKNVNKTYKRK